MAGLEEPDPFSHRFDLLTFGSLLARQTILSGLQPGFGNSQRVHSHRAGAYCVVPAPGALEEFLVFGCDRFGVESARLPRRAPLPRLCAVGARGPVGPEAAVVSRCLSLGL
ncbi:hypothetical protein [Streptomyces wuyuanensis]|uniref:hypothetical protein n=1 Tax=Streptomyces wuyuanensis TaxID=1196353 RepID=UPI0034349287